MKPTETQKTPTHDDSSIRQESANTRQAPKEPSDAAAIKVNPDAMPNEIGGPKGLEPTRYGDWEAKGRCYDF